MEKDHKLNSSELRTFLSKHIDFVFSKEAFNSEIYTPICIWGEAGIGKTQLVYDLAETSAWSLVHLSLAQIEETGDILGLPYLKDGEHGKQTAFAKPEWVPEGKGPGILLIDDFNRADTRILNAFMEVFQFYRTSSWSLPEKWFIVLTANPADASYFVQKVDQAVMDRMMHINMSFDLEAWMHWAYRQNFDEQLLFFPLLFPEQFVNSKISPRMWSKLFRHLSEQGIKNKKQRDVLVKMYLNEGESKLFLQFLDNGQRNLLKAEQLIDLSQEQMDAYISSLNQTYQQPLLLGAIGRSVVNYLSDKSQIFLESKDVNRFWMSKNLPADIRLEQLTYMEKHLNNTQLNKINIAEVQNLMLDLRN